MGDEVIYSDADLELIKEINALGGTVSDKTSDGKAYDFSNGKSGDQMAALSEVSSAMDGNSDMANLFADQSAPSMLSPAGGKAESGFMKSMSDLIKENPKLLQAGLLALSGGAQGLLGASAKDKEIKAYKEALETRNEQAIAAEQRLAQRAAYGKVGKQTFAPKDTGLLAAAMKGTK